MLLLWISFLLLVVGIFTELVECKGRFTKRIKQIIWTDTHQRSLVPLLVFCAVCVFFLPFHIECKVRHAFWPFLLREWSECHFGGNILGMVVLRDEAKINRCPYKWCFLPYTFCRYSRVYRLQISTWLCNLPLTTLHFPKCNADAWNLYYCLYESK